MDVENVLKKCPKATVVLRETLMIFMINIDENNVLEEATRLKYLRFISWY